MKDFKKSNEERNNYVIYKVENLLNKQIYVGATKNGLKERMLDHVERAKRSENNKFHQAIRTYGTDAFKWVEIDTAISTDELALKEKHYISVFKSKDEGYNSDEGGGFQKTVYQYNIKDGSLINSFNCLTDAGYSIKTTKQSISRACLGVNNIYNGFYWSYEFKEPFISNKDVRKKQVVQLNIDGSIVAAYNSVSEASISTGLSKTSISRVCRGERVQTGGFKWEYKTKE